MVRPDGDLTGGDHGGIELVHDADDVSVHPLLLGLVRRPAFLQGLGEGDGIGHEGVHGQGLPGDAVRLALRAREPDARIVELIEDVLGHGLLHHCHHARPERDAQIHLGKAEEAPVGAHVAEVEAAAHDGAARKGMPRDGGDGGHGIEQDPPQKGVQGKAEALDGLHVILFRKGLHPLEVDAVAEDLVMGRPHDEGPGIGLSSMASRAACMSWMKPGLNLFSPLFMVRIATSSSSVYSTLGI